MAARELRFRPSVLQWISSHGCAPFTAGVAWLSDDYWWRQI